MLSFEPIADRPILDNLSERIFGRKFPYEIGFVLVVDGVKVGLARIEISNREATLIMLGVLPEMRKKGYGDFFTRSLLSVMSGVSKSLRIDYYAEYFFKFGFKRHGTGMRIFSDRLVFPTECGRQGAVPTSHA